MFVGGGLPVFAGGGTVVTRYRAAWVLPIVKAPIPGGLVSVERDLIAAVGEFDGGAVEDLGNVAVLPGLGNAHTHLELSWMRSQVAPCASMPAWAAALMKLRAAEHAEHADRRPPSTASIVDAIREARAAGTCLLGDVTNTFATYEPLMDSELSAVLFRELLGFSAPDPDALVAAVSGQIADLTPIAWLRPSIAPHAPYSASPALLQAIARWNAGKPLSIHLAELSRLASARATVVACPRSNRWTGAGIPPIERFYASGVRVAVGTDSLASVDNLNLFAELAEVRRLAPGVPASRILESATLAGATALGFDAELGSISPGKRSQLLTVRLPADVRDVEEYLLGGVEPADVRWLDA